MTLLFHQLAYEQRMFWRSREAAVFIFIFPLLLYTLLGSVYSGNRDRRRHVPSADILLAGLFGYGAANTAFGGLAIILVGRRELGILKRLRSTPLPPATYLAAVAPLDARRLRAAGAWLSSCSGDSSFDANTPANWLGFAGAVVLGVACFAGLGLGAASLIRSAEGVSAVVNVVLLPMAFLVGRVRADRRLSSLPRRNRRRLPLTYFLDIVNGVYLEGESLFADPKALGIVARLGRGGPRRSRLTRFSWMPRDVRTVTVTRR